jgi:dihydrofolate reductase
MRKIILGVAVSLDNRIEGPNGEYDWCFTDQDYGMTEFLDSVDAIFYGRKSYDMMLKAPDVQDMFKGKTNYVFSTNNKLQYADATVVSEDLQSAIRLLKEQPGKNIWLFGGAILTKTLMQWGLVDELWLSVHPVVLGNGTLLFDGLNNRVETKLISSKTYDTGLVSLRYEIVNKP